MNNRKAKKCWNKKLDTLSIELIIYIGKHNGYWYDYAPLNKELEDEAYDPVVINDEGEVVVKKEDFLFELEVKRQQIYPAEEFKKYEKKKNLNSLIACMKEHFKTHYDDFTEEVIKFIADIVRGQKGI